MLVQERFEHSSWSKVIGTSQLTYGAMLNAEFELL